MRSRSTIDFSLRDSRLLLVLRRQLTPVSRQWDLAARRRSLGVIAAITLRLVASGIARDDDTDRLGRLENADAALRIVARRVVRREQAFRDVIADPESGEA